MQLGSGVLSRICNRIADLWRAKNASHVAPIKPRLSQADPCVVVFPGYKSWGMLGWSDLFERCGPLEKGLAKQYACMLLEQRYEGCQRGLDLLVRKVWPKAGLISALAWPMTPEDRMHHWQLPTQVTRPYLPFAITEWNSAYLSIEGSSLRIMFNKPALAVEFLDAFPSMSESTVRLLKEAHASR